MISNNNLSKSSRSPDPYQQPRHKKHHSRRHTLPAKFHYHPNFSHPYFIQHTHHLCNKLNDSSIDTSLLNQGIVFYQDPNNGETDFYQDNELEICSPSLMPENVGNQLLDEISGDSTDLEEKYFQYMAKVLNKQRTTTKDMDEDDTPSEDGTPSEDNKIDMDDMEEIDLDGMEDMVKEMNELLNNNNNQELKEQEEVEEEGPPSPLSPHDPEREGPVLSEEEENTEEGAFYRLEHDPEFQDEAGLMYGDESRDEIWPDDEGMDPMENQ